MGMLPTTAEQVISKCPLLCLDTSLCRSLQEATIDTRTLKSRLVAFTTLLDEVVIESGATKPRRILSSFKAARKRKAAASQLLDVAEALHVILSTLAQHQNAYQQTTEHVKDASAIVPPVHSEGVDDEPHSYVEVTERSTASLAAPMPCSGVHPGVSRSKTPTPGIGGHEEQNQVQAHATPDRRRIEAADVIIKAAVDGDKCLCGTFVSDAASNGCVIKAVPPLHLAMGPHSINQTPFQEIAAANSISTSSSSSDDSECSLNMVNSPCQPRPTRLGHLPGWDVAEAKHPKRPMTLLQDGLGCSSILENEPTNFGDISEHMSNSANKPVRLSQQQSARESDGFFTARSHFSPSRSTVQQQCGSESVNLHTRGCMSNMQSGGFARLSLLIKSRRLEL